MAIYSNKAVRAAVKRARKRAENQKQVVEVNERLLREYEDDLLILEKHHMNK